MLVDVLMEPGACSAEAWIRPFKTASSQITSPLQALVEPLAVASCDLDTPILRGEVPFRGPFAFGHEVVGRVKEVGEEVRGVVPGQQVVVPFQISCGTCASWKLSNHS